MSSPPLFSFNELTNAPLVPGAIYESGTAGNVGDDPISRLLPVGNSGGIRSAGPIDDPHLVVLYSTMDESEWPDEISDGVVTYHGDNRTPGQDLLKTPRHSNRLLHTMAERGFPAPAHRHPFLVFTRAGRRPTRSVRFVGLAVIGPPGLPPADWLVAKWFEHSDGRFLNYVVKLQLLPAVELARFTIDRLLSGDRSPSQELISSALSPDAPGARQGATVPSGQAIQERLA